MLNAARRSGVDPDRMVLAKRLKLEDYLARFRTMDLFLDTWPYNGGTTASDALWAGLPVLTYMGRSFASRCAASVLKAIDLPELITESPRQYEDLAVELATDPQRLAGIRRKLADHRHTTPLFDTRSFTRHLESAYVNLRAISVGPASGAHLCITGRASPDPKRLEPDGAGRPRLPRHRSSGIALRGHDAASICLVRRDVSEKPQIRGIEDREQRSLSAG